LPTLVVTQQPTAENSGVTISPSPAVRIANNDTGATDTAASGTVTAWIFSGTGTLNGTATVSYSSGVATFSNINITGSGAHRLAFSDNVNGIMVVSDEFTIS
jgi:hypothetical protein